MHQKRFTGSLTWYYGYVDNLVMRLNVAQKILSAYFVLLCIFWVTLHINGLKGGSWNDFYSFSFGLIPLLSGLWGIHQSFRWGGTESYVGQALLFISTGSFLWGTGTMIWAYYNFFAGVPIPYTSIADLFYILTIGFWVAGMWSLSHAVGSRIGFKTTAGKVFSVLIPIGILVASYYLLVVIGRDGTLIPTYEGYLKLILDLAYPLGDVIILTLAMLIFGLSRSYLGGTYKLPVNVLLLGFLTMYFADFIFSYTTTNGTFYTGNFGDLVFTVAMFLISFGTLGINVALADNT